MTINIEQSKKQSAKFWDCNPCGGSWITYREFMDWIRKTEPYFFEILDRYNWQGKKVAEIGCGQGPTLNYLPLFGAEISGLDMSFHSLKVAQVGAEELGLLSHVRLIQADAEKVPMVNDFFDAVISSGVLHHTSDPIACIKNIHRILKPGGTAIIMLYRSGNPKWWATYLLRGFSNLVDLIFRQQGVLLEVLRVRQQTNSVGGTALLELFGVPIIKAYSNRRVMGMFADFTTIKISNFQPGFRRLADIVPLLSHFSKILSAIDKLTKNVWGFYQVIEAIK